MKKKLNEFKEWSVAHKRLLIHMFICIILMLLLGFGFLLEDAFIERGNKLFFLSSLFLLFSISIYWFNDFNRMVIACIFILTVILIVIEYYSKYSMNYLYHPIYFVLVLFVILYIQNSNAIIIATIVTLASFLKFIQLILIEPTQVNIANFVFYGVVQVLLITTIFIAKAYYNQSIKTKQLYSELLDAYQKLNEYSRDIEELSAKEERISIARDLHDTLGHELTGLIMQLELSKYNLEQGNEVEGKKYLEESVQNSRNSLTKVRAIVDTLRNKEKLVFATQSLRNLADDYQKRTGMKIKLSIENEESIQPDLLLILYRLIQEALTNTAKHSQHLNVAIKIIYKQDNIEFNIYDYSGVVFKDKIQRKQSFNKGNGLLGMEERVTKVGGEIEFFLYSKGAIGFEIQGFLPRRVGQE